MSDDFELKRVRVTGDWEKNESEVSWVWGLVVLFVIIIAAATGCPSTEGASCDFSGSSRQPSTAATETAAGSPATRAIGSDR